MGDVVVLHGDTSLPLPVDRVLDGAKHCEKVLVLGWTPEGELWCASSMGGNALSAVDLCQRFIHKYYRGDFG